MTRKDFVLIAKTIALVNDQGSDKLVWAQAFADALVTTNANFDRYKFIHACMVDD